jgi:hypothetical protein
LYTSENQRIFFNEKADFMLEKLSYPRIFLYEKVAAEGKIQVHWRILKRFNKYPADLEGSRGPLRILSPCF